MRKKLFTFLVTVIALSPIRLFALDFEYEYEGKIITYTVIDYEAKTCMTKKGSPNNSTGGNDVSGDLILPLNPVWDETKDVFRGKGKTGNNEE